MKQTIEQVVSRTLAEASVVRDAATKRFQMRLDPPELGEVRIEIRSDDGQFALRVSAMQAETHALLSRNVEAMLESLNEQGLSLSELDLTSSGDPERQKQSSAESFFSEPPVGREEVNPAQPSEPIEKSEDHVDLTA